MSCRRKPGALLLAGVFLLAGCGSVPAPYACTDAIGCVTVAPGAPIRIGALQVESGSMGPQGLELLNTTELALADRGDELLGHPIELDSADSRCSGEGGTTAALQITADPQMVGIIGPTCSGAAAAAMQVVSEAGLVAISGSSSSPSLTSVAGEPGSDWQPGFYRTAQNDASVGRAAATYAYDGLGLIRAATINDGDPYTRGLTDAFEQAFTEMGGQVLLVTAVNKGDTDMGPVLTAVAASGAELLFLPVFRPEGDYMVLQAREVAGLEDLTLMTAEGLYFEAFIETVGEAGIGMYFVTPARLEGPEYQSLVTKYEENYGTAPGDTPYHAHVYDATNLLLNAIQTVAIKEADGTLHIGRQALRDALYATSGYEGLTGTLICDEYGDCGAIRLQVVRLDDPAAGYEGLGANVVFTYPPDE